MNIPDDNVKEYPDDNAIIINDPRIFRGVLKAAQVWGSTGLSEPLTQADVLENIMSEFASKVTDLQAKYEVMGDTLNAKTTLETDYYDELNVLLAKYRTLLFDAVMDYVSDDPAIDLMIELLGDKD